MMVKVLYYAKSTSYITKYVKSALHPFFYFKFSGFVGTSP